MSEDPQPNDRQRPRYPSWITSVEILDTATGTFLPRADLGLVGGHIAEQGRHGMGSADEEASVMDGSQLTAIPGLVDAHFHCSYAGHLGIAQLEEARSLDWRMASARANLSTALDHGITSILDVGSHGQVGVALRDAVSTGSTEGPRMRVCGQIIVRAGGPVDGRTGAQPHDRLFRVVRDQRDLAGAIEEEAGWGVDAIKLMISASVVQSDDPPRECSFSSRELRAAVKLSHEMGLLVCAHAEGDGPIRAALRAGVDIVQHASFVSRDTLREIRAGGTTLVFTPGVYRAIARNGPAGGYPLEGLRRVARHWEAMVRAIQDAAEAGIAFGVGSDAGGAAHPHGEYLEDVISLVGDCHFPVAFALTVATRGAALAARLDTAGTLQAGAPADLVLARSELIHHDLEAMRRASNLTVIQGGEVRRTAAV